MENQNAKIVQEIKVAMNDVLLPPLRLKMRQGDSGRVVKAEVYELDTPFDMTGLIVEFRAKKPDGKAVVRTEGIEHIGSVATIPITANTLAVAGLVKCELVMADTAGAVVGTALWEIEVTAAAVPESELESQPDYQSVIAYAAAAAGYRDEAAQYAADAAASEATAAQAAQRAETAADEAENYSSHPPQILESGNWGAWDGAAYEDTGKPSRGENGQDGQNGTDGKDGRVYEIVAGANVSVDSTDPARPVVSASSSAGGVQQIIAGDNISVDSTDPERPIISATGGGTGVPAGQYQLVATGDAVITATDPNGDTAQITAENLDAGSFEMGRDYYVFVTVDNGVSTYAVSANKDFDAGRLIGGFHYGKNRRVNANLIPINAGGAVKGAGWESNVYDGIVPRSVWTQAHRPKCDPEGMVYLASGVWVDIYLSSDDGEGGLASVYDAVPLTGDKSPGWYGFNERAFVKGKRLLSYAEWLQMALGSPRGLDAANTNAWTAKTNTAQQKTGYVANAVSSIGCRDAVGNVWECLDEFQSEPTGNDYTTYDPMAGKGYGKLWMYSNNGLQAFIAGAHWNDGADAGARTVAISHPWYAGDVFGVRCACDSL